MADIPFKPITTQPAGPAAPPGARPASTRAPSSGLSFSEALAQAMHDSTPERAESSHQVQAADQRLNELRADLNQVRQRVQQLQAFQAQAIQLYEQHKP